MAMATAATFTIHREYSIFVFYKIWLLRILECSVCAHTHTHIERETQWVNWVFKFLQSQCFGRDFGLHKIDQGEGKWDRAKERENANFMATKQYYGMVRMGKNWYEI